MTPPNSIAIVARHLDHAAGLGTYSRGLLDNLARAGRHYQFTIYTDKAPTYKPPAGIRVRVVPGSHSRLNPREALFAWEQMDVRRAVHAAQPDLVHWLHPAASLRKAAIPTVITVCDMIPYVTPGYLPNKATKLYAMAEKRAIKRADHLITISEFSKREIMRLTNVPDQKITVTYLAGPPKRKPRRRVVKGRYILFLGGSERRKNPVRVIQAFAQAALGDEVRLVVAGSIRQSFVDDDIAATVAALPAGVRTRIDLLGKVEDADLTSLYAHADLFVFPSLSEGFGLPVLEAMAYGVPVVTSSTTSLPEVAGKAATLVDPTDTLALSDSLRALWQDTRLRAKLSKEGVAQSARFTWPKTAEETVAVYDRLLRGASV